MCTSARYTTNVASSGNLAAIDALGVASGTPHSTTVDRAATVAAFAHPMVDGQVKKLWIL